MTDADLLWLRSKRPAALPPSADKTAEVRSALLADTDRPQLAVVTDAKPTARRPRLRFTAFATAAAVAVAAVAAIAGFDGSSSPFGTESAKAAPLIALSNRIVHAAPQSGDATLVERLHTFADGSTMTGADLYTDGGAYYYSPTKAGLPAEIRDNNVVDRDYGRLVDTAVAALTLPIDQARKRMANANYPDGVTPKTVDAPGIRADWAKEAESDPAAAALLEKRLAAMIRAHKSVDPVVTENHAIWGNSLDTLLAGAGRADVRAGVLRLLASIPEITVSNGVVDGRETLELTSNLPATRGSVQRLTIDAATGIPIHYVDGIPGQTPDVVMEYTITRVSIDRLARR